MAISTGLGLKFRESRCSRFRANDGMLASLCQAQSKAVADWTTVLSFNSVGVVRDAAIAWMVKHGHPGSYFYPVAAETADDAPGELRRWHWARGRHDVERRCFDQP